MWRLWLVMALLLIVGSVHAATEANLPESSLPESSLPEPSWLEAEIGRLGSEATVDEALVGKYQELLSLHQSLAIEEQTRQQRLEFLEQYPTRRQSLEKQLTDVGSEPLFKTDKLDSPEATEQALAQLQGGTAEWRRRQQRLDTQRNQLLSASEALPTELAELEQQLRAPQVSDNPLMTDADTWLMEGNRLWTQLQLESLRLQQQTLNERTELIRLEQQLLERRLALAGPLLETWRNRLAQFRLEFSRPLLEQAQRLQRVFENGAPRLKAYSEDNVALASELEQVQTEQARLKQENERLDDLSQELSRNLEQVRANLYWLQQSRDFGRSLRRLIQSLPRDPVALIAADDIANAHVRLYELSQQGRRLDREPEPMPELAANDQQALDGMRALQRQLVEALQEEVDRLITSMTELDARHTQFSQELEQEREFLRQQLLWIRTGEPLWQSMQSLDNLVWFGSAKPLARLEHIGRQLSQKPLFLAGIVVAGLLLLFCHRMLRKRALAMTARYAPRTLNLYRDRFFYTLKLMAVSAIGAGMLPLWVLMSTSWVIQLWPEGRQTGLVSTLLAACLIIFIIGFVRNLSYPDGVLSRHLLWPKTFVAWFHRLSGHARLMLLPLLVAMILVAAISGERDADLQRLLFVLLNLVILYISWQLLKRHRLPTVLPTSLGDGMGLLTVRMAVLLPMLLGVAMATWGLLAANSLFSYHQLTLVVMLGFLLLYALGERWLRLEQGQLAIQRARARREENLHQEEVREGIEPQPDWEEDDLSIPDVSEQSKSLLRGIVLIALALSLFAIWSEALANVRWLEDTVIWQVDRQTAAGLVAEPVTLEAFILAVVVLVLTFFAASNLPGFLELLLLRRLNLAPGTGYAVTTLVRYILLLTGTLTAFSHLGFQWSQLQWLVAAFSVGLGFGLQEIFANFVSGLILLFERPIRIGDIVTINNLSGTVTRINTRATTIVDWDRKEIVVPNKAFITDQLINWSLSDPINREVLTIGVAYGSDIDQTEALLHEIARAEPAVMSDPPPQVYFLNFGASSLDFELRIFLSDVGLKTLARHAINKEIDHRFREAGIEIAFPQLDLHIKDTPEEKRQ